MSRNSCGKNAWEKKLQVLEKFCPQSLKFLWPRGSGAKRALITGSRFLWSGFHFQQWSDKFNFPSLLIWRVVRRSFLIDSQFWSRLRHVRIRYQKCLLCTYKKCLLLMLKNYLPANFAPGYRSPILEFYTATFCQLSTIKCLTLSSSVMGGVGWEGTYVKSLWCVQHNLMKPNWKHPVHWPDKRDNSMLNQLGNAAVHMGRSRKCQCQT